MQKVPNDRKRCEEFIFPHLFKYKFYLYLYCKTNAPIGQTLIDGHGWFCGHRDTITFKVLSELILMGASLFVNNFLSILFFSFFLYSKSIRFIWIIHNNHSVNCN